MRPRSTSERYAGEQPGLARDLAEAAALTLAMAAKDCAQLAADLVSRYAQSRTHNAQSISPPCAAGAQRTWSDGSRLSLRPMATLLSVNLGRPRASRHTDTGCHRDRQTTIGRTGRAPRPRARSGAAAAPPATPSAIRRSHGGTDQAVYAYAREDLDHWQAELGRPLTNGVFGENLTTSGLDVNGALVGERWQVGDDCVLEVTSPRIPCRTFAGWLEEQLWVKRFTQRGAPGAYLRVIVPGSGHRRRPRSRWSIARSTT